MPRAAEHLYEDVDDAWVMLECRSAAANPDMQLLLKNMGDCCGTSTLDALFGAWPKFSRHT